MALRRTAEAKVSENDTKVEDIDRSIPVQIRERIGAVTILRQNSIHVIDVDHVVRFSVAVLTDKVDGVLARDNHP